MTVLSNVTVMDVLTLKVMHVLALVHYPLAFFFFGSGFFILYQ